MTRLPHILSLLLVFGSMWLHGVFLVPSMDHDIAPVSSCLVSCLNMVHVDGADEALSPVLFTGIAHSTASVQIIPVSFVSETSIRIDSHHDPSQILTTQKRE